MSISRKQFEEDKSSELNRDADRKRVMRLLRQNPNKAFSLGELGKLTGKDIGLLGILLDLELGLLISSKKIGDKYYYILKE